MSRTLQPTHWDGWSATYGAESGRTTPRVFGGGTGHPRRPLNHPRLFGVWPTTPMGGQPSTSFQFLFFF
jgi:hypothetical protein